MATFELITLRAVQFRDFHIEVIREKRGVVVEIPALQTFHKIELEIKASCYF